MQTRLTKTLLVYLLFSAVVSSTIQADPVSEMVKVNTKVLAEVLKVFENINYSSTYRGRFFGLSKKLIVLTTTMAIFKKCGGWDLLKPYLKLLKKHLIESLKKYLTNIATRLTQKIAGVNLLQSGVASLFPSANDLDEENQSRKVAETATLPAVKAIGRVAEAGRAVVQNRESLTDNRDNDGGDSSSPAEPLRMVGTHSDPLEEDGAGRFLAGNVPVAHFVPSPVVHPVVHLGPSPVSVVSAAEKQVSQIPAQIKPGRRSKGNSWTDEFINIFVSAPVPDDLEEHWKKPVKPDSSSNQTTKERQRILRLKRLCLFNSLRSSRWIDEFTNSSTSVKKFKKSSQSVESSCDDYDNFPLERSGINGDSCDEGRRESSSNSQVYRPGRLETGVELLSIVPDLPGRRLMEYVPKSKL